ncbi:hypothetical protein AVEN_136638-1 [Araneus ventricosus]|uniref:Uncharacterized protein n=1 Tax=Araneus ventricosus TaxID=182803 RepID=A0A4Y2CBH3_ARAVE|nr:hypothetical protein AVEN_136638-1 [Araneus ventricosus]
MEAIKKSQGKRQKNKTEPKRRLITLPTNQSLSLLWDKKKHLIYEPSDECCGYPHRSTKCLHVSHESNWFSTLFAHSSLHSCNLSRCVSLNSRAR